MCVSSKVYKYDVRQVESTRERSMKFRRWKLPKVGSGTRRPLRRHARFARSARAVVRGQRDMLHRYFKLRHSVVESLLSEAPLCFGRHVKLLVPAAFVIGISVVI
jgi:hypothetical protein